MKNILKTTALVSALLAGGCATNQQYTHNPDEGQGDFANTMDGLTKWWFTGGGLLSTAGAHSAKRGDFASANLYGDYSQMQRENLNRENAIQAAREGRSQININMDGNQNYPQVKTVNGLILGQWFDSNNNKVMDGPDMIEENNPGPFGRNSNIQFFLDLGIYGNRSYFIRIQNSSGKIVDEKRDTLKMTDFEMQEYRNNRINFKTAWNLDCSELGVRNSQGQLVQTGTKDLIVSVYLEREQTPRETQSFRIYFDKIAVRR